MDGYAVETCETGGKALALLSIHKFDLVLADLSLPDSSGVELIKQIKYHYPGTDVVIMTAFGSVSTAVDTMRAGAYDYITKPFPRDLLRVTVKRCLENHSLRQEISKIQSELFKKDKLATVGAMAGAIAHRMRNPLSIIQMCAQYLERKLEGNEEYMEILSAIEEKVKTLEGLTRDFVEFSRASRIKKASHRIDKLVEEVLRNSAPKCAFQKVEVLQSIKPDLPPVLLDADLIQEVLINLIDNALEAMKGPGKILLSVELDKPHKRVYVSVANSGSVLPNEIKEKIFEPFFTTKETGMGLGLAIVKQVVEGHGGKIQALGDPKNNTTTFRFYLPLTGAHKEAE